MYYRASLAVVLANCLTVIVQLTTTAVTLIIVAAYKKGMICRLPCNLFFVIWKHAETSHPLGFTITCIACTHAKSEASRIFIINSWLHQKMCGVEFMYTSSRHGARSDWHLLTILFLNFVFFT